MTGRFEISNLVVDPAELKNAKERKNLGFVQRTIHAVIAFIWKSLVSVISLLVLAIYFAGFYYFLWGRRIYDEFWQGMANQYQELPEARVYQVKLHPEMMEFWENFSFKCRRVGMIGGSIGGMLLNTMFKIRKIEGHIDPQDYVNDSHMFEVEGLYRMKKRPVIDYKYFSQIKTNIDFESSRPSPSVLRFGLPRPDRGLEGPHHQGAAQRRHQSAGQAKSGQSIRPERAQCHQKLHQSDHSNHQSDLLSVLNQHPVETNSSESQVQQPGRRT